jgi:hypothetical protein
MRIFLSVACLVIWLLCPSFATAAGVPNGNEYALSLVEAQNVAEIKSILDEGVGRKHFFRYLEVLDIKKGQNNGAPVIGLKTREPSSDMIVKFLVQKSNSLAILQEEPATQVGDALAVLGVIERVEPQKKSIVLNPVIVRYKDRATPKAGKEMLSELDSSAIVYSFTGGRKPVNVSRRDQDLVVNEKEMIKKLGKDGWAEYLLREIARRDKEERTKRNACQKSEE